jgi:hypothetical protein
LGRVELDLTAATLGQADAFVLRQRPEERQQRDQSYQQWRAIRVSAARKGDY